LSAGGGGESSVIFEKPDESVRVEEMRHSYI
jgi:hypothetical protein